jgi:DNA-binding beta-propeller fold protein YncE
MRLLVPSIAAGIALAAGMTLFAPAGRAQQTTPASATAGGPYLVKKTTKVGGDGGFDYVYADSDGRRLYIARSGPMPRVTVFDLDTLASVGEIPMTSAHGAAVDAASHHGFASSKPVAMWDTKTLSPVKTITVDGGPDGILADPFNHRIYVFSHRAPNATVIDANDGSVIGTIDLGGAPEQAASDGKGKLYVDLEDKDSVAVVDAKAMKVTATYSLNGKGGGNAGLALDPKNHVLFVACRNPQTMVMLDANDGKYLADLPIGQGCDGAVFNPDTMECFSSQGDGTLTIIKETSPTTFVVEQTVKTLPSAKTLTLDSKTGNIYLIAAEFGPPPAAPADGGGGGGGRYRRGPMLPGSFSILTVGK